MRRKLKRLLKASRVLTIIMITGILLFLRNEFHISKSVLAVQSIILYKLIHALIFVSICLQMKDKEIKDLIKKVCKDTFDVLATIIILLIELLLFNKFDAFKFIKIVFVAMVVHFWVIIPIYFQKEVYATYELKRRK